MFNDCSLEKEESGKLLAPSAISVPERGAIQTLHYEPKTEFTRLSYYSKYSTLQLRNLSNISAARKKTTVFICVANASFAASRGGTRSETRSFSAHRLSSWFSYFKTMRLRLLGHVCRLSESRLANNILDCELISGLRSIGPPSFVLGML